MKIINVVGARPNFMKMAPIIEELNRFPDLFRHLLVHTGQHYSESMSDSFFRDLGLPLPDINLGVGSGTHAEQTARVMVEFEKVCIAEMPDLVIVVGDVNSTMACTITAKKLGIRVAHVEAGLRSRDMGMPEEINRLCTDVLCDYLFTTDHFANENLAAEGVAPQKVHFVGNVMIDTLLKHKELAARLCVVQRLGLAEKRYAAVTLHRPSNVDDPRVLTGILEALNEIACEAPVVFAMHPRTRKMVEGFGLGHLLNSGGSPGGVWAIDPLGYLEFLCLNMNARMVITDSGGLQEETTVLGIPCITIRQNTERPVTCEVGSNLLAGTGKTQILDCARRILSETVRTRSIPEKWDGMAARRIVEILAREAR